MRTGIGSRAGWIFAVSAALALGAAACSSGGGSASGGGEVQTAQARSTTTAPPVDAGPDPSSGCGTSDAAAIVEAAHTVEVAGTERSYLVTVPTAHDGSEPLPLLLDFHGLMEGSEIHAGMTQYSTLAEEEGFVAVFPHGSGDPVRWNINPNAEPNEDLLFFDALIETVGSELCVDLSRVYATGLSNRAMFTSLLVCQRAGVLAAAAPVAGITDLEGCAPSRPVPVVTFHGTDDPILLFNGGVDMSVIPGAEVSDGPTDTRPPADIRGEGYPASVAAFAERNGCDPEPADAELTPEVIHRVYECPEGAAVEFYIVVGGGHSWPGSEFSEAIADIVGYTTFDIDATRAGWEFMSRFARS